MKYLVTEKRKALSCAEYQVEANSPQEAIDKFNNELAGSITPFNEYITIDPREFEETVTVDGKLED